MGNINIILNYYAISMSYGGQGGIRTRGTAHHRSHTFQACAFNRSATCPHLKAEPFIGFGLQSKTGGPPGPPVCRKNARKAAFRGYASVPALPRPRSCSAATIEMV
jgi:hypothetical protein